MTRAIKSVAIKGENIEILNEICAEKGRFTRIVNEAVLNWKGKYSNINELKKRIEENKQKLNFLKSETENLQKSLNDLKTQKENKIYDKEEEIQKKSKVKENKLIQLIQFIKENYIIEDLEDLEDLALEFINLEESIGLDNFMLNKGIKPKEQPTIIQAHKTLNY